MIYRLLVPTAVNQLRVMLTATTTPDTVRMKAIEKVLDINKVGEDIRPDETKAYMAFLQSKGLSATVFAVALPPEYAEAFRRFSGGDRVVDGQVVDGQVVEADRGTDGEESHGSSEDPEAVLFSAGSSPSPEQLG